LAAHDYQFVTHWRVRGTPDEVWEIIDDPLALPNWWPSVYLSVTKKEDGSFELHTKGWLPYTLKWSLRQTQEADRPHTLGIEAWGDFDGTGLWTFAQDGETTNITYDWRIRAEKPLLRVLSFLLKPVFSANHRWAMARGEESLKAELVRRRQI
jgi:carbon monoxide dehydrogenase subunit G